MLRRVLVMAVLVAAFGGTGYGQGKSGESAGQRPEPEAKPSVAGVYHCEGNNPDGSPYQGLVEISAVDGTYLVHWMMADGMEVLGVGILRSGVLAVSYFGGTPAVAVYRIDGDRLHGEWTMGGAEGMLYNETLTRMPGAAPSAPRQRPERPAPPRRTRPVAGVNQA